MRWLLALAEDAPRLTPDEWAELQRQTHEQQIQQMGMGFWGPFWLLTLLQFLGAILTVWMVIYCIRNDSDRQTWLWILLFFPGLGPVIYFLARWLPSTSFQMPTLIKRWTESGRIRRLESAAQQIGNPYQFIELGDALREVKLWTEAAAAYETATRKEPQNLPALWGLANSRFPLGQYSAVKETLEQLLQIDPAYKFGDVSLLYGRTLHRLADREAEIAHWQTHIKRWRQPEAMYSLAERLIEQGEFTVARQLLQQMIADIEITPRVLAKKVFFWKGRGKKLLRSIPPMAS